ncbi:AraC family transcriptional regulator [Spongiivirga citrea]|uniref:Helix-turn-helix domain-containing protein n=1 Tax=Spongiivirga citrea TaxID=1481457 RepID=A0A6M0CIQ3_9FLAO|nr:AraC family transcriptional regulator [Spongiivirga citrea]NER17795.1 helix-turn-helix domain-containing protein [Spongiivirga citrea]
MKYISAHLYRKIIEHAINEGMDSAYFETLTTPYGSLSEVKAVPANEFFALHESIDQTLGPGFSIRVGQQMKIEDYGVLGLSWRTCSKAGEIFERSERYFKLLSDTYVFKVEKNEEYAKVLLLRDAYRRGVGLSNEATFSATVVVMQGITETKIAPIRVSFKHSAPKDLNDYETAFQCPVLFNQSYNSITYKREDFDTKTAKADISINAFLVERVEEETKGIEVNSNKVVSDVSRLIEDALPSGIPGIEQISTHIGMSSRTLTRRLSSSNISFRELVKSIQQKVSENLLLHTSRSVGEIAFLTGFSEQSAFNRAFKKWTDKTPVEFRKTT